MNGETDKCFSKLERKDNRRETVKTSVPTTINLSRDNANLRDEPKTSTDATNLCKPFTYLPSVYLTIKWSTTPFLLTYKHDLFTAPKHPSHLFFEWLLRIKRRDRPGWSTGYQKHDIVLSQGFPLGLNFSSDIEIDGDVGADSGRTIFSDVRFSNLRS